MTTDLLLLQRSSTWKGCTNESCGPIFYRKKESKPYLKHAGDEINWKKAPRRQSSFFGTLSFSALAAVLPATHAILN